VGDWVSGKKLTIQPVVLPGHVKPLFQKYFLTPVPSSTSRQRHFARYFALPAHNGISLKSARTAVVPGRFSQKLRAEGGALSVSTLPPDICG
jgi:hypothetical protein